MQMISGKDIAERFVNEIDFDIVDDQFVINQDTTIENVAEEILVKMSGREQKRCFGKVFESSEDIEYILRTKYDSFIADCREYLEDNMYIEDGEAFWS